MSDLEEGSSAPESPKLPKLPKARGALLRAAVAEKAEEAEEAEKVDFVAPPPLPKPPSPRPKKPRLAHVVGDLGPAKAPFQQFQNLSGMFAERDSELKELHEELDELLGGFGLEHLMQSASPSAASAACSQSEPSGSPAANGILKPSGSKRATAPPPPERTIPGLPALASGSKLTFQEAEAAEQMPEGPMLPMPHGPAGPTPRTYCSIRCCSPCWSNVSLPSHHPAFLFFFRTVWGSPQSYGTSPHSPHHAPGSVRSEPGRGTFAKDCVCMPPVTPRCWAYLRRYQQRCSSMFASNPEIQRKPTTTRQADPFLSGSCHNHVKVELPVGTAAPRLPLQASSTCVLAPEIDHESECCLHIF